MKTITVGFILGIFLTAVSLSQADPNRDTPGAGHGEKKGWFKHHQKHGHPKDRDDEGDDNAHETDHRPPARPADDNHPKDGQGKQPEHPPVPDQPPSTGSHSLNGGFGSVEKAPPAQTEGTTKGDTHQEENKGWFKLHWDHFFNDEGNNKKKEGSAPPPPPPPPGTAAGINGHPHNDAPPAGDPPPARGDDSKNGDGKNGSGPDNPQNHEGNGRPAATGPGSGDHENNQGLPENKGNPKPSRNIH